MTEFLAISILIILAAISPGPDFAMVIKNSLRYTRRAGIFTALGVSSSLLIHASYCILGLALIISRSLLAFSIIKYLGAAYLFYVGIKSLLAPREQESFKTAPQGNQKLSDGQAFRQGLWCNLFNPKAIMFLLAFFTLVVKPGYALGIELGYGFEIALIHLLWFSSLAYLMTHSYMKANLSRAQFYIVKAMGVVLIAFSLRIATLHQALS